MEDFAALAQQAKESDEVPPLPRPPSPFSLLCAQVESSVIDIIISVSDYETFSVRRVTNAAHARHVTCGGNASRLTFFCR
jgi:hypothetical protein